MERRDQDIGGRALAIRALTALGAVAFAIGALSLAIFAVAGSGDTGGPIHRSPALAPPPAAGAPATALPPGPGAITARLLRPTQLRARPGGPPVARLTQRTEYGSPRVLAVVQRRGNSLGVITSARPNHRLGWLPMNRVELARTRYVLRLDLSQRRLTVRTGEKVLERVRVGVGRSATPTPVGNFAVTDKLRLNDPSSPYGCCVLALSAHQTRGLSDWPGGDRIAIHVSANPSDFGSAVSHGCVRAPEAVMRRLLKTVPLGTPVEVRA